MTSPILEIVLRRSDGRAHRWRLDLEMAAVAGIGAVATALAVLWALSPPRL